MSLASTSLLREGKNGTRDSQESAGTFYRTEIVKRIKRNKREMNNFENNLRVGLEEIARSQVPIPIFVRLPLQVKPGMTSKGLHNKISFK